MNTTTLTFTDATYVPAPGGPGRSKDPNPFTTSGVIAEIALKVDGKGKPLAKAFSITHGDVTKDNGKDCKLVAGRYKRLLSEAGDANSPAVTVKSVVTSKGSSKTESTITFWTVKKIKHAKKETPTENAAAAPAK